MRRIGELDPTPIALLLTGVLVSLLAVSLTSLWRFEQTRREARHSRDLRETASNCLEAALDVETGQRGYLLTGRDGYLAPYHDGRRRLPALLDRLDGLTADVPAQHDRARQIRRLLDDKLRELGNTITLAQAGQRAQALAIVESDEGRHLMDDVRALTGEVRAEETRRLDAHLGEIGRGFVVALALDLAAALGTLALGGMLIGINRNLRHRRELEEELRRQARELGVSREQLTITLRSIGDAVMATDRNGVITFLNPVAAELTGWTADEALGQPLARVFHIVQEGTRAPVQNPVDKVIEKGHVVGLANHTLLIRKDGTELAIADSAAPLRLSDGSLGGVVLVFRDVTDARREERRADFVARAAVELGSSLEHEETLRTVARLAVPEFADWSAVDLVDEGVIRRLAVAHVDPRKVTLVEEIARRWPSDPAATTGVANVVRTGKSEMIADIPRELLDRAARDEEHRRLIHSLNLRSYIAAPLVVRGKVIGAITFAMAESNRRYAPLDLAAAEALCERAATAIEHARLYREAQKLRADAELANRAKDEFLAMLGHELRNPLAPIVTALHLVRQRVGTQIDRELTVLDRQLRHVVRLVDDLLDVSRITRGQLTLAREPVDVADVVAKAIELARPILDERHHHLAVDAPPGIIVSGDPVRLTQVVSNLLTNSAKYTDAGGHIDVRARRDGERVTISVRDDGIGIAPDVLPRVFELFVQESQSLDRSKGGLGLGLAIVRSLVRAHDGTVTARSDGPGRGSEFVVELPALSGAVTARLSPVPRAGNTAGLTPTRLIVVDDNEDAAELLSESLALYGYEAHKAVSPDEALALAARIKPAIALLDLGLPVMDGYELARRLRKLDGLDKIRLIAITGYGQPSDRERSRAAGFDAHLVKPISVDAVRLAIEQLS